MSTSFPLDGLRVRFAGETNVGMKREHNEDSFFLPKTERLAIVADGMGGHASGEVASRMAVDTIVSYFQDTTDERPLTWPFKMDHGQEARDQPAGHRHQAGQPEDLRRGPAQPQLPGHGHHAGLHRVRRGGDDRRARRRQPHLPPARGDVRAAHRGSLAAQRLHQDEEPLARGDRGLPAQERHRARAGHEEHGRGRRRGRAAAAGRRVRALLGRPVGHGDRHRRWPTWWPTSRTSTGCASG